MTVGPSVTPGQVVALTARTGYSRFPVVAENGAFMGYLHVKDVLDLEESDRAVPQQIWRPMTTLRAELPLDDALTVMRRAATHLAQVADASGKVLGLVALEDVLELLVGEVRDPAHREVPAAPVGERRGDRGAGTEAPRRRNRPWRAEHRDPAPLAVPGGRGTVDICAPPRGASKRTTAGGLGRSPRGRDG